MGARVVPAPQCKLQDLAARGRRWLGRGRPAGIGRGGRQAAVLGFRAYGAYEATNLAVLKGFSVRVALVDVVWGTFATAMAGWALAATAAARSAP